MRKILARSIVLWLTLNALGCTADSTAASTSPLETQRPTVPTANIGTAAQIPIIPTASRTFTPTPEALPTSSATLIPEGGPVDPALHTQSLPEGAIARLGKGKVHQVAVSSAANAVAAVTSIGVYVFHLGEDGHTLEETWFGPTTTPMRSVAFSPDGKILATGSQGYLVDDECDPLQLDRPSGIVTLWNAQSGEPIRDYQVFECFIESLEFTADGRKIAFQGDCFGEESGPAVLDLDTGVFWDFPETRLEAGQWTSSINAAVSPEGNLVASGFETLAYAGEDPEKYEYSVIIIDAEGDREPVLWEGFETSVNVLAFSPDGLLLAAGSEDGLISLWDVSAGVERQILTGPGLNVARIAFSPSGKTMAAAFEGGVISLWNTSDWSRGRVLDGKGAETLEFSSDESVLLSAGRSAPVVRWELAGGAARDTYPFSDLFAVSNIGISLDFSPDGKYLAAGGRRGSVTLFDWQTLQVERRLRIDSNFGTFVSFAPDGKTLAGSADGSIRLWNVQTGDRLRELAGDHAVFSPDGHSLAYSGESEVVLFDWIRGERVASLPAKNPYVSAFTSDGRFLAYSVEDGLALWDVTEKKEIHRWDIKNFGGMYIAAIPGKDIVVVASLYHDLVLLGLSGDPSYLLPGSESLYSLTKTVNFSSDGSMGAFVSGNVTVWAVDSGFPEAVVSGHACHPTMAKFSPDGRMLATSSYDDTVLIWDLLKVIMHSFD